MGLRLILKKILAHPSLHELEINSSASLMLRKKIVMEKVFLRKLYEDWYTTISLSIPNGTGRVLELGSGGGFMNAYIDNLITSDIVPCPGVQMVIDAQAIPFENNSLRAIVMTDVLHHLPRVRQFFNEATRCVCEGGVVIMIEPWLSKWSNFIFGKFHSEPCEVESDIWEFAESGPLSGANQALPWIIFKRDRLIFENEYPGWKIRSIKPLMPFRYLLSGGISMRSLMPGWSYHFWCVLERALEPYIKYLAMFAQIELLRISPQK